MKKFMSLVATLALAGSSFAAVTYTQGTGISVAMDKLGAHQNGGRGCVGCHAPHSGARGNGGSLKWNGSAFVTQAVTGDVGDETLWGQDIGPVIGLGPISVSGYTIDMSSTATKIRTGVVYCLSCHDGNVAKGAMMTNQSFEQVAGVLPATYGSQPIPTLLGNDGGTAGNYENDHPIGPAANMGKLGSTTKYVDFDNAAAPTKLVLKAAPVDNNYNDFKANYGLPIVNARSGAGWAVESTMTAVGQAYVVCTTCHTPHTMYTSTASGTNPIAGLTSGTFPTYFFIAAPYNPGANTANGTKASSATQFCRQCHFSGAGGSNEASGISGIATAF